MKNLLFLILIIPIVGCIGPLKELESQIQDVYFDGVLDNAPEPLPDDFVNQVQINQPWLKEFDLLPGYAPTIWEKVKEQGIQEADIIKAKVKVEATDPDIKLILK